MAHEPKLTAYTIELKPANTEVENTNRLLFRNKIQEANENPIADSYIFTEVFRKFISALDTPEMYSDVTNKKCMTANQTDIESEDVNSNIFLHSDQFIMEGRVEGGSYGRKRNKTSTVDKTNKTGVSERDAITDDFYFLLYCPLHSSKSILLLQSYSDDSIDSVMKKFWLNFLSFPTVFNQPSIKRFVPRAIIDDFKTNATVSSLTFTSDILGETLLGKTSTRTTRNYRVTVKVSPISEDLSLDEFNQTVEPLQNTFFTKLMRLGDFTKKQGTLRDNITNKTSPFDLGSSFEVQPSILLSKYITIQGDETDFDRIRDYSFSLLESIKSEIYLEYGIQER